MTHFGNLPGIITQTGRSIGYTTIRAFQDFGRKEARLEKDGAISQPVEESLQ